MSNFFKQCICSTLYSVGVMFCSGAIIQTFLLQAGFSAHQVYLFNSLIQFAQVLMMILLIFISHKIKQIKIVTSLSSLSLIILTITLFIGAIKPSLFSSGYIIAIFITAVLSNLGVGLYSIIIYCLPYYIFDRNSYAKILGTSTAISGIVSFIFSFLHTYLISRFDYFKTSAYFFLLSIISFILTAIFFILMKEKENSDIINIQKNNFKDVFKNKNTYLLLFPNFARGIATGIMSVITVIAISKNLLNERNSSYVNIITQISLFLGNVIFAILCKKINVNKLLIFSTIGITLLLPISMSFGKIIFLIVILFIFTFRTVVDSAIPVMIMEIIPKNQIGAFTSIRMLVFIGAQALSSLLLVSFSNVFSYTILLIIASVMQLFCGIIYYLVVVIHKKQLNKNYKKATLL